MASPEHTLQAQSLYQKNLLAKSNVVGVAVGFKEEKGDTQGDLALVVLVNEKKPLAALDPSDIVPPEVDGVRTDVYEVGYLRAQQGARDRYRPVVPGGVSIGHYKVTAGTLGTLVKDRVTGEPFLLSNNHVFANSNDALVGDAILQPAAIDGGQNPADLVAKLERFIKLRFTDDPIVPIPTPGGGSGGTGGGTRPPSGAGCDVVTTAARVANAAAVLLGSEKRLAIQSVEQFEPQAVAAAVPENLADCALARPVNPAMFSDDIKTIGMVTQTKAVALGMRVSKFGRTTGYTEGTVTLLNATVNIQYNTAQGLKTARFVGQTITEGMSEGGDSGSLVVDTSENKAVGLLFAGSTQATIFTPIEVVLNALNVSL
jgi:hypothetical protein